MFYDAPVIPSSPCTISKACWEDIMGDTYSYEHGMIYYNNALKESTPRTENVSMASQVPYSPVIKQESDCGYSQTEYTYISSSDFLCMTPANTSYTSNSKTLSWESLFDEDSRIILDIQIPQPPPDHQNTQTETVDSFQSFTTASMKMVNQNVRGSFAICSDLAAFMEPKQKLLTSAYLVTLNFTKLKSFLGIISLSGPAQEYRLPIFKKIESLDDMLQSGKYDIPKTALDTGPKQVLPALKNRYVSRLTRRQLALVLGIHNYDISLVKDIENVILAMCDQLCGLKIGESSWSRIPRLARKDAVLKVYRFATPFFPNFTMDNVLTIIKRGAYSRTQEFLRRKRRRERKYSIEQNMSAMKK
ncbi:hypothetical protein METBIDRAFT_12134 [Metschnikowia bicuspidata var. bicuspidata NRRL YB-4993]|uniref:Uncharacterized protein n=1 Tax=Metschnikowia bicuspidata var. bicuspidata NRRL YB-4993 TaxID=869754 RepID=A0A1A0HCD0_9ASCO|nr:hypothetical protein METBIDRAFT_12134 [Metschnikowia bicuspidata var. bicuspidata NRRL YB-4993]OBA21650.1 hypothetical protein METBIDRAFT_12134 [Metschnikowia bicuspidata var. bicuspidata NRRL YB-4993]